MRPKIEWPDGKKICATLTVAFEAFTRGGHFKKAKGLEVNLVSLSHANYGGNARLWRIVKEVIGKQPVGWVSPGGHHTRETLGILADEGYTWSGDQCDDDLPYVVEVDGKRMVIIPKHWFFNDWRAWNGGASNGEMAFQAFKDGFDFVRDEALRGKPGRIDALVHAELGGRPYMAHAFEKMIKYLKRYEDEIWF